MFRPAKHNSIDFDNAPKCMPHSCKDAWFSYISTLADAWVHARTILICYERLLSLPELSLHLPWALLDTLTFTAQQWIAKVYNFSKLFVHSPFYIYIFFFLFSLRGSCNFAPKSFKACKSCCTLRSAHWRVIHAHSISSLSFLNNMINFFNDIQALLRHSNLFHWLIDFADASCLLTWLSQSIC